MAIKVTTENKLVTLATAGKFCQENIQVEFSGIGGGSGEEKIDQLSPYFNKSLVHAELTEEVISLPNNAFENHKNLESINMSSVTSKRM